MKLAQGNFPTNRSTSSTPQRLDVAKRGTVFKLLIFAANWPTGIDDNLTAGPRPFHPENLIARTNSPTFTLAGDRYRYIRAKSQNESPSVCVHRAVRRGASVAKMSASRSPNVCRPERVANPAAAT